MTQLRDIQPFKTDILVIGGGGAGLRAAIAAREAGCSVRIVSKSRIGYGNNTIISAGIFAASGWGDITDNPTCHAEDTLKGGRYLNNRRLVEMMTNNAGSQVDFMARLDASLNKKDGRLNLFSPPGHTYPRHINFTPQSGREMILPMRKHAESLGILFDENVFISTLFKHDNRMSGAFGLDKSGGCYHFQSKAVILATGGYAQVYRQSNNATGMTGDGHILAWRLGVPLSDMEMVQFYPTALGKTGRKILLYEPVVIEMGARLRNKSGDDILEKYQLTSPNVMTRDRVCRALYREIQNGEGIENGVILDLVPVSDKSKLKKFLPDSWDESQTELVVTPTTHFCMGGVAINEDLSMDIPGLFAAGEICAGLHGANRLAGNALSEVLSLGELVGVKAGNYSKAAGEMKVPTDDVAMETARLKAIFQSMGSDLSASRERLKLLMWQNAGISRNRRGLEKAISDLDILSEADPPVCETSVQLLQILEYTHMLTLARMICQAALAREESRGAHFREDFPEEDNDDWLRHLQFNPSLKC